MAVTVNPAETLLLDLQSSDAAVRNTAALKLMDSEDPVAILPLLEAIAKPENANHRGTLVYALGGFECLEHLEVLVDLVVSGNFEVASCAFSIIENFEFTSETIQRMQAQLDKHEINHLPFEHGPEAYKALAQLISDH